MTGRGSDIACFQFDAAYSPELYTVIANRKMLTTVGESCPLRYVRAQKSRACSSQKQRALVYLFSSTGARPKAIADLQMKHLEPIGKGCLSIKLYENSLHEMYSFLHENASDELRRYFVWRESKGEKITPESYIKFYVFILDRKCFFFFERNTSFFKFIGQRSLINRFEETGTKFSMYINR